MFGRFSSFDVEICSPLNFHRMSVVFTFGTAWTEHVKVIESPSDGLSLVEEIVGADKSETGKIVDSLI